MPLLLAAALVVVPLLELYLLLQVGQQIGALPTLALLVLLSLAGAYLLRREGSRTWRAVRQALAAGRMPAREVLDGGLVVFGGALLLTPGFATDALGLLCVLPPSRAALRRALTALVARRLGAGGVVGAFGMDLLGGASRRRPARRPASRTPDGGGIVEGQVVDPLATPRRPDPPSG